MEKAKNNNTEEPIKKQPLGKLETSLWKAADKLRKNIDAAEYKHIVLGLIFLKYISDAFEELFNKLTKGEGEYAKVSINGSDFQMYRNDLLDTELSAGAGDDSLDAGNHIVSPIPGKVFKINVKPGGKIKKGQVVVVIDAMKMENNITSKRNAVVKNILVKINEMVEVNTALIELEEEVKKEKKDK